MTGLKFLLTKFVEKDYPIVVFRDSGEGVVKGAGTIKCKSFKLKNVFYVKGHQSNLISVNQICDTGYKVLFDCNERKSST